MQTGTITLVSADAGGGLGDSNSFAPSISADGKWITFLSNADNLVAQDTNSFDTDVFVKNLQTSAIQRVSADSSGHEAHGVSGSASISLDGRYVAFSSSARDLVSGDDNGVTDNFLKDTQTGVTTLVSSLSGHQSLSDALDPSVSGTGRYIVFSAFGDLDGGTDSVRSIFVKDTQTGVLVRVSTDNGGALANGDSYRPSISSDGRYVVFASAADNLVDGDTNGVVDVFVKDLTTGAVTLLSRDGTGTIAGDQDSFAASISADGSFVAFQTATSLFSTRDQNSYQDVYRSRVLFTTDSVAPDTSIIASPPVYSGSAAAHFAFDGTDAVAGVDHFEVRIDGAAFAAAAGVVQDYAGLAEGAHTFAVRAVDAAGNADDTPASYTWTVDLTAPDTVIASKPPQASVSTSASFSFGGTDTGSGVNHFEMSFDGGAFEAAPSPQSYSGLAEGSHTFNVRAVDAAGNTDATPATYTWTVDHTAPDTTITAHPAQTSNSPDAKLDFSGTDTGAGIDHFEVRLDGGIFIAATGGSKSYSDLQEGHHTFEVRAVDAAGNSDPMPAAFDWTVNTVSPTVSSVATSPASGLQTSGSMIRFSVTMSDAVTVVGAPKLLLSNGGAAGYASGSGTSVLAFTYLATLGQATSADLAVAAFDLNGGSIADAAGNAAVMANVVGNPPGTLPVDVSGPIVQHAIADQLIAEDHAWSFVIPADAFADADGDALGYTATLGDGSVLPAWLGFDAVQRAFFGTPPQNFSGTYDLKVAVSDKFLSAFDTFTFTVTPLNDAPEVTHTNALTPFDEKLGKRLIGQSELLANVVDAENDPLTAAHLTVVKGTGALVDNHDGTWSFTPAGDGSTSVTFSYEVTDGAETVADNATLTIVPVLGAPPPAIPVIPGTPGNDELTAEAGSHRYDAGAGVDMITFSFKLTDAVVMWSGNEVVIDGPSTHAVLGGFEVFRFTDGIVSNVDDDPLVDDLFYYSTYHDIWTAHADADQHFHAKGWHESRDPNAFFSTSLYLSANPDVKAAGIDPLTHFDTAGWKEGRVPSIAFDPLAYLAANPDVKAAGVDPLLHFLQFGYQEGRQPVAPGELIGPNGFDYVYYLRNNPDVAAAHVDSFQHFETMGWKEGRNPNALFDVKGYLAIYSDVAAAHVNPLDPYSEFGWHEGRDPSVNFDTLSYLTAYADVNAAHVNPLSHFLQFGINEGRSTFADGVWG
jgi:Tol biopolymer transport system component